MQSILFENTAEIRRNKDLLEEKLNVKISFQGKRVTIEGPSLEEYEASIVLDAIKAGFSAIKALSLKEDTKIFRVINIKSMTKKKNLELVRARLIGTQGRTKRTIEDITGCDIVIKDNDIGIIADAELIEEVVTAISNLARGTKQANTYRYLEKMNTEKKKYE
ncbi:MAG: hypothetical protein Q7S27_03880 [Nanoarchaeota archaeon]|nr:hypothetical protein [Nanoarchaeota archaeon]